jgi:hypothetical protein
MELYLINQYPETGIQYLAQLQNKFEPCNYGQFLVDLALISAYMIYKRNISLCQFKVLLSFEMIVI